MAIINPAFHNFPEEAALIGRLLAAFGELEFSFCRNAGMALNMYITVARALYNLRQTSSRVETADILAQPEFEKHNLLDDYERAHAMVWHCLKIRNQYAHCNWGDDQTNHTAGLFFADLQASADRPDFEHSWKHVDIPLLQLQEQFFAETREWLDFIRHELAVRKGELRIHFWPRPTECELPPRHNLASEHVPPWLDANQKARHLERTQETERGGHQPERPPSILRLTREEWAAKDARDAREGKNPEE
jgi:hypothetical protein